jgi:hypothetical protein
VGAVKAIVVHRRPADGLREHVARLDVLPRRALSLPADGLESPSIAAFVELWGDEASLRASIAAWPAPASAWLVDELRPADAPRRWPSGAISPGARLVGSVHRKAGLDRAAFAHHWRTRHVEVAMAFTIPVWRYSQNVVLEVLARDPSAADASDASAGPEEDGFAVLHFRSRADLAARWADHPDEARRGAEDAARFMRVDRGWSVEMTETLWEAER